MNPTATLMKIADKAKANGLTVRWTTVGMLYITIEENTPARPGWIQVIATPSRSGSFTHKACVAWSSGSDPRDIPLTKARMILDIWKTA